MTADITTFFCQAQNVFGNGTTVSSTDWIDIKKAQDMAGGGDGPFVEIIVTTTFLTGTSAQFQLVACDAAGANPVVLDTTRAIPIAELVAPTVNPSGVTRLSLRMSPQKGLPGPTLTHLRVQVVNVGNNTAGAISAQLTPDVPTNESAKAYAAGW
jgi:hypothetical protein